MTFKENLYKARSYIIFLLGLVVAFGIIIELESRDFSNMGNFTVDNTMDFQLPKSTNLTAQEMEWARVAWKYFQNNYHPQTGLVNSVDQYPAATLWDTASYLLGLISAYRLEIVDQDTFDVRMAAALEALSNLKLFEGKLPNKAYNTVSTDMINYNNQKTDRGIGWSAIDIGRVLVPLNVLAWNYPQHTAGVKKLLSSWDFDALLHDGVMYGAALDADSVLLLQEGRIGYEEYAAKSLSLMGRDVFQALKYTDFLKYRSIYGIDIPTDKREPEQYHAHNYVVSESYILDGLEYGWDEISREFAYRVYKAQERRFKETGILTAVSEDNLDRPPYFVYNTVYTSGKSWNCITEAGEDASEFKTISTKAAIGWYCLYQTDYTRQLVKRISKLYDPEKGWYSGIYEKDQTPNKAITCNTNGIVLEALCYKKFGRLVSNY